MKSNISFYSHDVDSHNHWKFKTLRRKYDWAGEGKFWALNNMIAKSPNCLLDISSTNKKKAVAAELEFTLPKFEEFINFLADDCELINVKDGVLSSDRTQEDLKRVNRKREGDRDHKSLKNAPILSTNTEVSVAKDEVSVAKTQLSGYESEQIRLDKIIQENTIVSSSEKREEVLGADAPPKPKEDKKESLIQKQKACMQRRELFKAELRTHREEFSPDMINAFYKYWVELNKSKTKMKWEMQQTWELKLRLYKWEQNNQKFNHSPQNQSKPQANDTTDYKRKRQQAEAEAYNNGY
jgi:hypothetical protein